MNGAEVVVDHVAKAFEHGRIVALQDASVRLEPGELVALTGPARSTGPTAARSPSTAGGSSSWRIRPRTARTPWASSSSSTT
jgi:hypothetical protein